jgi:hypothetical protein
VLWVVALSRGESGERVIFRNEKGERGLEMGVVARGNQRGKGKKREREFTGSQGEKERERERRKKRKKRKKRKRERKF